MQRLRRFARVWDLVGNSGNFQETLPLIWEDASPFAEFLRFSDWLAARAGRLHSIALASLAEHLYRFLIDERALARERVAAILIRDWQRGPGRERLPFLEEPGAPPRIVRSTQHAKTPKRQTRHFAAQRP